MKRKLLIVTVASMMTAGVMAQSDITPPRYVFANQPEGLYLFDGCNDGWGPGNVEEARAAKAAGYLNISGSGNGSNMFNNKEAIPYKYYQSGLQILDLTAEGIGKVLCFRGANCNNEFLSKGVNAKNPDGYDPTAKWPQITFYSNSENTPAGANEPGAFIRVSITYKAIQNEFDIAGCPITQFEIKSATNNVLNSAGAGNTGDMMVESMEDETYFDLNEGWRKVEYDFQIGTIAGSPFAFSVKLDAGKLDEGAFMIKEIKFTTPSDGAYAKGKPAYVEERMTLTNSGSVIVQDFADNNKILCTASDNVLSVSNLKSGDEINVYSVSGTLVASQIAFSDVATLPLASKGFYIVKVGGASLKVANK